MPDPRNPATNGTFPYPSLADLPGGWGAGKVVESARLAAAAGAEHVGFDPAGTGLVASEVQSAIAELALSLGTARETFVFRPGGVASGNVYPTFPALYAVWVTVPGPKELQFDNSLAPCLVPAGVYDFSDGSAVGLLSLVDVVFAAGVSITGWFASCGFLTFDSLGVGPLVSYVGGGLRNHSFHGTTLFSTNLLFEVGAGANVYLNFDQGSYIATGPQIRAAGGTVAITLYASGLGPNAIADDGVSTTFVNYDAASAVIATQPGATTPPTYQPSTIASPEVLVPKYTVDSALVSSLRATDVKTYATIKAAIAAAEAAGETSICVQVISRYGVPYLWDGADSGYAPASSMSVEIETLGDSTVSTIDLQGTFPDCPPAVYPILKFRDCNTRQLANVDLGDGRQFFAFGGFWQGGHFSCTVRNSDSNVYNCGMTFVHFTTPPGGYLGWHLTGCQVSETVADTWPAFENSTYFLAETCIFSRGVGSTFGLVTPDAGLTCNVTLYNTTVVINDSTNVGAYTAFDTGVGGAFRAPGLQYTRYGATSTVKLVNTTATTPDLPLGITSFVAGQIAGKYIVDKAIVDSVENAAKLTFSTIKRAVANAESLGYSAIQIQLMHAPLASPHAWDGADSGFAALSDLGVVIMADPTTWVSLTGVFPAAAGTFPCLSLIGGFSVDLIGNVEWGVDRQAELDVTMLGHGFRIKLSNADMEIRSGLYINTHFYSDAGVYYSAYLLGGVVTHQGATPLFANVDFCQFNNNSIYFIAGTTASVVTCEPLGSKLITLDNCSLRVRHSVGGAVTVFDSGAGTIRYTGLDYTYDNTGGGALLLHDAAVTLTQPVGLTTFPADSQQAVAVPVSGVAVTVPLDVRSRHVYGDVLLTPGAGAALWTIEVETGIGTGIYNPVAVPAVQGGGPANTVIGYSFSVAGGRRYRFTAGGGGGVTETIAHYSYTD